MHCLDANALIDYLGGVGAIGRFVEEHDTEPLFAPTAALYETFVGAARLRGTAGVEDVRDDLAWVEPLPVTVDGATEAALVDAELHAAGEPIGALDTLIAGVVREAGGTIVSRDRRFERVDGLEVHDYGEESVDR